jgi:hypothetical protein
MQGSVNNWRSNGERRAPKGMRRSKNYLKPTGHLDPGLQKIDSDDPNSFLPARRAPQHFKRVMSFVRANWKIVIPAIAIAGAKVLIRKFGNDKHGNRKNKY